jgi:hypothetical protein
MPNTYAAGKGVHMRSRVVATVGFLVMGLVAPWSAGGEATPAAPAVVDVGTVREKVSPGACKVTILNSWGLLVAHANGFLLGQGHFVVTDLGRSVSRASPR